MKQHAFLITAYHSPGLLNRMLSRYADAIHCYVHIDRKSTMEPTELLNHPNVTIIKRYNVNWGGINHWLAFLELMTMAAADGYDYYHLLTGQDYIVAPLSNFDALMGSRSHVNYDWLMKGQWTPTLYFDRYHVYRFYDQFNVKHPKWGSHFWELGLLLARIQRRLGINRPMPLPVYAGNGYCSLTHEATRYILDYLQQNPSFLNRMKHTFCAEEIMFPTILMNSPLRDQVSNDCLRFISWEGYQPPRILDESDYPELTSGKYLFARKIHPLKSARLLQLIDTRLGYTQPTPL